MLDSIIDIAAGVRSETRRLSFHMASAGASARAAEEVVDLDVDEEEEYFAADAPEGLRPNKRKARVSNINPFSAFKKNKEQGMEGKIDEILKSLRSVAREEDIGGLHRRILKVESGQTNIVKAQKEMAKRINKLEKNNSEGDGRRTKERRTVSNEVREDSFIMARKALYISPAEATEESVRRFFINKMKMDQNMANDLGIVEIKKHYNRVLPPHRRKNEQSKPGKVKVTFEEMYERDVVLSHAYLLHSDCSVEVVIPEHLAPLKRHLESFAYRMRRNARESDSGKVSTQVRLNEEDCSLVLAVRRSGQDKWSHYTRDELRREDAENKKS